jgi:aryl-alcohol dehydrogenase-like predicted oxidoreductase
MIYRTLGKTGLKVSTLGMGCSGIGKSVYKGNYEESIKTLREAFESGINFFDTAPNYNNGDSEKLIGRTLKNNRDNIIIASKVGITFTAAGKLAKKLKPFLNPIKDILVPIKKNLPNLYRSQRRNNFSREFIFKTVEGSLKRLKTDYLDLLLLHHPTNHILETGDFCEPFELLKSQGKIRFYGVSCDSIEQAVLSLKLNGISFIQIELNMLDKEPIKDVLPIAAGTKIGVGARIPLAKGLFTDKNSDTKAERWAYDREIFEKRNKRAEKYKFLLKENRSMVQAALQFLMRLEAVSVTLPGFSNRKHLNEILNSISAQPLNKEELEKIYSID